MNFWKKKEIFKYLNYGKTTGRARTSALRCHKHHNKYQLSYNPLPQQFLRLKSLISLLKSGIFGEKRYFNQTKSLSLIRRWSAEVLESFWGFKTFYFRLFPVSEFFLSYEVMHKNVPEYKSALCISFWSYYSLLR